MLTVGLDIGTTTISAVVYDGRNAIESLTLKNDSFYQNSPTWERAQNVEKIVEAASHALDTLIKRYPKIERIGLTGQQHGIVYIDSQGKAVSPLYTWQDGRGNLEYRQGISYAEYLSEITGYPLASGYGCVTHFYNLKNGLVDKNAAKFCTIHDYIAMLLCSKSEPIIDSSDGASFGAFDIEREAFDIKAIEKAGIGTDILPKIATEPFIGRTKQGIEVYCAIGDNQASFIGATGAKRGAVLVNIGTGSQLSVHIEGAVDCSTLELRPFPLGGYLLVGSSLCGGRAFAILEKFMRDTSNIMGAGIDSCYERIGELLEKNPKPSNLPIFTPLFCGTRSQPNKRAAISGLDSDNFTPLALIYSLFEGMADEMYSLYEGYLDCKNREMGELFGSGNGLRKNKALCKIIEEKFGKKMTMPPFDEEAALGAAIYASL